MADFSFYSFLETDRSFGAGRIYGCFLQVKSVFLFSLVTNEDYIWDNFRQLL